MIRRNWIARLFAAAVVAVGVSAAPAKAGLFPVSVSIQPEAGNFRWTYNVVLPTNMKLQSGDYFTIYDFGGYVPGSASLTSPFPDASVLANWSVTSSLLGKSPGRVNPNDDPNVPNVTWTYNGPDLTNPTGGSLGNFSAASTFQDSQGSFFTGINHRDTGEMDQNVTETISPTGQINPPTPGVPEPATLALAGLGLPLIGARWLRRKK